MALPFKFYCPFSSLSSSLEMVDIDPNFTCSDPELSGTNITEDWWGILSQGRVHENSITAVAVCQVLIVAIGAPWNLIVLATIVIRKRYKDPTYILLLNLVLADLLVCLLVLPFNIQSAFAREFSLGSSDQVRCRVCHTISITIVTLVFTSLFTLALMSLDRLVYLKWGLWYKKTITVKLVIPVLAVVWVFCILVSLPPVFGFGEIKFANLLSSCSLFTVGRTPLANNIFFVMLLVLVGAFPFITTLFANSWLLVLVCKSVSNRYKRRVDNNNNRFISTECKNTQERDLTSSYHKEQIHLAEIFGAIFAANVITWFPTIIISIVAAIIGADEVATPAYAFVYLSYVCQPAIHPVLETCLIGKARSVICRSLFCCCFKDQGKNDALSTLPSTNKSA